MPVGTGARGPGGAPRQLAARVIGSARVALVRLGLNIGYWGFAEDGDDVRLVQEAERLGYSTAWVAEAYGSDAPTILSWIAAQTSTIDIGAAVLQIPARTPAMTAMTAATLDTLSGGRFRLGLGVSGPQVSEGWHGARFGAPLARTREYVDIVRMALRRQRVRYDGQHYRLPLPDGPGKSLHLMIQPPRVDLPIYLAAIGPRNVELAGEIADGWIPVFFAPEQAGFQLDRIASGARKAGRDPATIDIAPTVPVVVGDDWRVCADAVRGYVALYVGGMGSREQNFYNDLACRMGFEEQARQIQDLYLDKNYTAAMEAVPLELLDATSLLGPIDRIADRMTAFADVGVGTLNISPLNQTGDRVGVLRAAAEAFDRAGLA